MLFNPIRQQGKKVYSCFFIFFEKKVYWHAFESLKALENKFIEVG
jgi:hypothetical protein